MIEVPFFVALRTYTGYALLIGLGHILNLIDWVSNGVSTTTAKARKAATKYVDWAPLVSDFEYFFVKRMYGRVRDCWNRPISSKPGSRITVLEREAPSDAWMNDRELERTGNRIDALNLGSYNYLGFGDGNPHCEALIAEGLQQYGVSACSSRADLAQTAAHNRLDALVARFVGKEDAITFAMGYQTNSTVIPALVGKGGLIVSDSLNHASLVVGCKASQARIRVFKHNDPVDLEAVLRSAIAEGQPRTHRPWTKILILVEGIYSMEGEILRLPEMVRIKRRYGCYLYVDEAHSIGALGPHGKGVCDHCGVSPDDVDILMGTFTKSFGAVGGYIAADRNVIAFLRQSSFANFYDTAMSVPCVMQIIGALEVILGEDGTDEGERRIANLRRNSNLFSSRLKEEGFLLLGDEDSPVVPVMLFIPGVVAAFSRLCLEQGVAVVVVGFPATPLLLARVRFCLSAAHTEEDIDYAVKVITSVGSRIGIKFGTKSVSH